MRDTVANFATSTLSANLGTSDTTLSLSSGTPFPTSNFLVQIDSELILISSLSGTVAVIGARGEEGTTVATHTSGTQVAQPLTGGMLTHLWDRLPDRLTLAVPPIARGGGPDSHDDEFTQDQGWWTFAGSDGYATWDMGQTRSSYFSLKSPAPNASYLLYKAWTPTQTAWSVAADLSLGGNPGLVGSYSFSLFVSDTLPLNTTPQGGIVKLGSGYSNSASSATLIGSFPTELTQASIALVDGTPFQGVQLPRTPWRWAQMLYDGATLTLGVGTSWCMTTLLQLTTSTFMPRSIGLQATVQNPLNRQTTYASDWLRVTGS